MHARGAAALAAGAIALTLPLAAGAWGDEGHEIVGLIAAHYLSPQARAGVAALLAGDDSGLTRDVSLAVEATWADHYRDSDRSTDGPRYRRTRSWHFVDIEVANPDIDAACFGHPALPAGVPASQGPPDDCIIDKIGQFRRELTAAGTAPGERRLALQFLLHFVGDIHQPLHAADRADRGGNDERVRAYRARVGSLHHYWDTVFVARLGRDPAQVADALIAEIDSGRRRRWSGGDATEWARESMRLAVAQVYGRLPAPGPDGVSRLPDAYVDAAVDIVRTQLERGGVRLAWVLNQAFAPQGTSTILPM